MGFIFLKIRLLSDIHLEFKPFDILPAGEDLIVLAGDIGLHITGVRFAKQVARNCEVPVLVIAGNHEFYQNDEFPDHTWEGTPKDLAGEADHTDVVVKGKATFLEDSSVVYEGVRFIGTTLWTDMNLFGDPYSGAYMVWRNLADYECIFTNDFANISTDMTIARHRDSLKMIRQILSSEPFVGPTVVITHHAPSSLSIADEYKHDLASAGFASRLEDLILDYQPELWCHGHCHSYFDYVIGGTRVVCNPRGYPDERTGFDPNLIIDLST